ncbi:MAG: hypothetical protein CO093_08945 [Alphaproteobacteria bacterium CG_4_9_14_3_um_filter_47_13]|nr:MAG: hypothetical protein CO093_08945 [Alphaproteobacteria bacterium CG_4_9_14_3_um_filter_47_13]
MSEELIVRHVPKIMDLASQFRKEAKVSDDGNTVEVGHYTAKKKGLLARLFSCATAQWKVHHTKNDNIIHNIDYTLPDGYLLPSMPKSSLIALLVTAAAIDNVPEQDRQEAYNTFWEDKFLKMRPK